MSVLSRIPLSPVGWVALGVLGLGATGAALLLWPRGAAPFSCPLDAALSLPSGQAAMLCEVLPEPQPFTADVWLVLRVLVPDLPPADLDGTHADHDWICRDLGLPRAAAMDAPPDRIVVQLMSAPFPRGEAAPGIRQSIEAYTIATGSCMWELL
ncbi:hypothetical protein roselon_00292 [Roseibacterium elongatum DSM 19469]|uniref:Uncharacterized protein n=1 Tax=Roseicyclus elongatus DSM 19469 TaxID=1294273 RepID=W8SJQ3_9RHOB|nr:DUF6497 family protein [Roseibacterium elongatum]AHM02745.1 hypothetical protein roselon_00292 [Roseibacterium elongatum DSM 19469]